MRESESIETIAARFEAAQAALDCKQEVEEAIAIADRVVSDFPESSFALRKRAWIHSAVGDLYHAIADITVAIGIDPVAEYYALRGRWNFELGDFSATIRDESRAIELEKESGIEYCSETAYFFRSAAYLSLGEFEEAQRDCDKVRDEFVIFTRAGRLSKEFILSYAAKHRSQIE